MNLNTKAIILSLVTLLLVVHYLTLPYNYNFNKSIGWGLGIQEYYGLAIMVLLLISIALTTINLKSFGLKIQTLIPILLNLSSVFLIGRIIIQTIH